MSDFHITDLNPDPVLTGIVGEHGTGGPYLYDIAGVVRPVGGRYFRYSEWDFAPMISEHADTNMPPSGPANAASTPTKSHSTGVVQRYGLKDKITDDEMDADPNPATLQRMALEGLTNKLRLGLESELKTGLDAASNSTTLTGTAQWNNASAKIEKSIDDAKEAFLKQCGFEPTHIVVPPACWQVFKRDSTLRNEIRYTRGTILDGMGGLSMNEFGLQFVIPGVIKNTANEGATASVARLWSSDKVYLLYVDPSARSSKDAMTAVSYYSHRNGPEGERFMATSWRPTEKDQEWTWYYTWEWHKLVIEAELVHRLDDVLA